MKFKIIEQDSIHLAGTVYYGNRESKAYTVKVDTDDFQRMHKAYNKEHREDNRVRREAYKAEREKDREKRKEREVENGTKKQEHYKEKSQETYQSGSNNNFETAMSKFGDMMESLGRHIENNAKTWEENIVNFGHSSEVFAEDFGKKMEAWGTEFGERMGEFGERMEDKWVNIFEEEAKENKNSKGIKKNPLYQKYEELYNKHLKNNQEVIKQNSFYEVQVLDTELNDHESMVMIGSRITKECNVGYPVAVMTFNPEKWVAVKLTADEYEKDWLNSLDKAKVLKEYKLEPYFMVRHSREKKDDLIKVYCPITKKEAAI